MEPRRNGKSSNGQPTEASTDGKHKRRNKKKEIVMKATKILSTGALAAAIALGGLSVRGYADSQTDVKGDARKTVQGAEHKCGSGNCGAGNCGASNPEDQEDKKASEKQAEQKKARNKGASHSCGAGSCG